MHAPIGSQGLTRRRMVMALPLLGRPPSCQPPQAGANTGCGGTCTAQPHGCQVDMVAQGTDAAVLRRAMERAWQEMERQAAWMTHFHPDSTVSAINRAAGKAGRGGAVGSDGRAAVRTADCGADPGRF